MAILIDGIHLGKQVLVVALGIESSGKKQVLGLWQGATENTTVVKELLEDLVVRGLNPERRYLFVIDGAKALRAGIERVFGERAEVQRCQIHKRRNVKEHLPKSAQGDTDRRIRNAYAMTGYAEAKAELGKIFRQLERINPSAAHSLEEGLEETLTGAPAGRGNAVAANVGFEQSHRVLLFHRRKSGTECETLASRGPRAALDGHRITGSGKEIPEGKRLSGTGNAAAQTESVIDSAGTGRVRCPIVESRHFQLNRGQFPAPCAPSPWAAKTTYSPAPMPAASEPLRSTA